MSSPRPKVSINSLKRHTPETLFFIDFAWWEESNRDLETYITTRLGLGDETQIDTSMKEIDLVDPITAEVRQVDGFQYMVQTYFSQLPEDFLSRAALIDAVFCTLLANANRPMSIAEISSRIQRRPELILQSLGGPKIYQGIRPYVEN